MIAMRGLAKSDLSSQSWATHESSMDGSHFSDEMSDEVTIEQQRKEELAAMAPPSDGSVTSGSSRRTEQWVNETCRERANEAEEEWPNSNVTNEPVAEEGCSRAPLSEETNSRLQVAVDQDLTYVENANYSRPQGSGLARGITRVCAYGKHRRGRPPKAQKKRLVRAKAKTRKKESTTNVETEAPAETATQAETENPKSAEESEAPRYQLRSKRQPRYKCGTCGLRDCVCLLAVKENRRVPTGGRGIPPEEGEKLVHRLTVRAEKTYSAVERSGNHPVDAILEKLSLPGVEKAPCPRFKEWTSDEKGLEFTLPTVMPPVPNNIAFGPSNFEREPVQMARCITADLLCDKYGVQMEPGGVYSPAPHWWLLVTAPRVETIVEPLHLLSCLESLRTLTTTDLILCFHIIDWYRGKVKFAWWLELIITCFTTYPRIRLLDEWTHTFEVPLFPKAALGTLDTWVKAGSDNRAMPRSVWQDLAAIQGRAPRECLPSDNGPGREIVYPEAPYPNSAEHVSYDETDLLQVEGDIVLACPADLKTNSAALRYVLRECGIEKVFSLQPKVGEMLTIPRDVNPNPNQSVHLLIVRANQRAPLLTDDCLRCMTHLLQRSMDKGSARIHLPILDPERPTFSLVNLYYALANMFEGTGIHVVLHSRVYASILSIGLE